MSKMVPLDKIAPDPEQPRRTFDPDELEQLAASILAKGLLQPIIVRLGERAGAYIIVAGERRYRAHRLLRDRGHKQFSSIEVIVREMNGKKDIRVKQIIENLQRADVPILEEADALADLVALGMTAEEIAADLGLAEFRVRWRLQLLNLSPEIRKLVACEQIDKQQAMEVSRLERHADQTRIVGMINRRELVGWKAVRNAVDAIINKTTLGDLFGEMAPSPRARDVAVVKGMEEKIDRIVALLNGGWRDGECIIAGKVSPDRAAHLADQLGAIKTTVSTMERELRNFAAQAKIAFEEAS